jgi:hypothetical protein
MKLMYNCIERCINLHAVLIALVAIEDLMVIIIIIIGGVFMKAYTSDENMNLRSIDRSPYRNMSEKCLGCAYAYKSSAYGVVCSVCPIKEKNKIEK